MNAIEHVSENVHTRQLCPRTIGHKIRTIKGYRPLPPH
jgi:hypothetical protein